MTMHATGPAEPTAEPTVEPALTDPTEPSPARPSLLRRPVTLLALVVAALAGLLLGGGAGAGAVLATADPTQSDEYRALQGQLSDAHAETEDARATAAEAEATAAEAEDAAAEVKADYTRRQSELSGREREVAAREEAVKAVEDRIAATSIGEGIWTVGVDVEPGTYRTKEALTGYCYWAILKTGTNGSDIIDNDGPEGGFPTVTLSAGQDFENSGCGTFVKQ